MKVFKTHPQAHSDPKTETGQETHDESVNQIVTSIWKLINEMNVASSQNATTVWQRFLINFLREAFFDLIGNNLKNPKSGKYTFSLCLTGSNMKGCGTPLSDIDAFLIVDKEEDVVVIQNAAKALQKRMANISKASQHKFMNIDIVGLEMVKFCGTRTQLIQKMQEGDFEIYRRSILAADYIAGNHELLTAFKNDLCQLPLNDDMGKPYRSLSDIYYHQIAQVFNGPRDKKIIHLKRDLLRPIISALDALRFEHPLLDFADPNDPLKIIAALEEAGRISPMIAALFNLVISKLRILRWNTHIHKLEEEDEIELNDQNYNSMRELIDAVAIIRGIADTKIIKKENSTIAHHFNSISDATNLPYLDNIYRINDKVINVDQLLNDHIQKFFSSQKAKFIANVKSDTISRIFNFIDPPTHSYKYNASFNDCINRDDYKLNQAKFDSWLWDLIINCVIPDLFDDQGEIRPYLKEMFNHNNFYDKQPNKSYANCEIIYSYIMNCIYMSLIKCNKISQELLIKNQTLYNPDIPVSDKLLELNTNLIDKKINTFLNEFFDKYIYSELVTLLELLHIKSVFRLNGDDKLQQIYVLLTTNKIKLETVSHIFGKDLIYILVSQFISRDSSFTSVTLQNILNNIHSHQLSASDIAALYGNNNCKVLITAYSKQFDVTKNNKLLLSVIEKSLNGDKIYVAMLAEWLIDISKSTQLLFTLTEQIELKLKNKVISLGVIKDSLGISLFEKIVFYIYSQKIEDRHHIKQYITDKISQYDLTLDDIADNFGKNNRNIIVSSYLQSNNIQNNPLLIKSVIISGLSNDPFSQQLINELIVDDANENFIVSSIAAIINEASCTTDLKTLRESLSQPIFIKLISYTQSYPSLNNRLIKLINDEVDNGNYDIDQIVRLYGDTNRNNILNNYILYKNNNILPETLLQSLITKAFAKDTFCQEKLITQLNGETTKPLSCNLAATHFAIQLREGVALDDLITNLNKDIISAILFHIFGNENVRFKIIITTILAQISKEKLPLSSIAQHFGEINRDALLNNYFVLYDILHNDFLLSDIIQQAINGDSFCVVTLKNWFNDPNKREFITKQLFSLLSSHVTRLDAVKEFDNAIYTKLIQHIFSTKDSHKNENAIGIIDHINANNFNYDEIGEIYGAQNINAILTCHFKIKTKLNYNLLNSLINKAFVNDLFCKTKLNALFNESDNAQIIELFADHLVQKLNNTHNIQYFINQFGTEIIRKIIGQILKKDDATSNIAIVQILKQIEDERLSLSLIENYFGVENKHGLLHILFIKHGSYFNWPIYPAEALQNTLCNFIAKNYMTLTALLKLNQEQLYRFKENYFDNYFSSNSQKIKNVLEDMLDLNNDKYRLLPLVNEGLISRDAFKNIEYKSIEYTAYKTFVRSANWNNKTQLKSQFQKLKEILLGSHCRALNEYVLKPINQEINRLNQDGGSSFKADGTLKAQQMIEVKNEIKKVATESIQKTIEDNIVQNRPVPTTTLPQMLYSVANIVKYYADSDGFISNRRNKVAAFFKGLLGVMLSLPVLFTPLLLTDYRNFFFKSTTVQQLENISEKLTETNLLRNSMIAVRS